MLGAGAGDAAADRGRGEPGMGLLRPLGLPGPRGRLRMAGDCCGGESGDAREILRRMSV